MSAPSRTHASPEPAKLTSENFAKAFCWRAICCSGGAIVSPSSAPSATNNTPAIATARASRQGERPAARITVISLPRAKVPSPSSAPMRAPMGSKAQACCGRLKATNVSAFPAV